MRKRLPAGSCDSHFHVFEEIERFPFGEPRSYTPPLASMAAYLTMCDSIGVTRSVLVHPSVYGRDHRSFEAALSHLPERLRGVAVVYTDTPDADIERWHKLGTRGTRFNALFAGGANTADLHAIADRVRTFGWHVQLLIDLATQAQVLRDAAATGLPVVVDHFGHSSPADALASSGFQNLLAMLREGRAWVKLSGAYRVCKDRTQYVETLRPLVEAFIKANPKQLVWGSDWPHPSTPPPIPVVSELADLNYEWLDETLMQQVFVENPARLYGWV